MKKFFIVFFLCVSIFAEPEIFYSFSLPEQEKLFKKITSESRCLVCQNQSLADSDAPLAVDLRNSIYQWVMQGRSEKAIQDLLVQRYGAYILFRPPLNSSTWMLWASPFLLLVIGLGVLVRLVKRFY